MLDISRDRFIDTAAMVGSPPRQADRQIRPMSVLGNLRKHAVTSTALVVVTTGLGLCYALTSTPLYTASTQIIIDARRSHAGEPGAANRSLAELGMDPASIDSQVAVLGSEQIASVALKQLHLDQDVEFATPTTLPGLLMQRLRHALGHTSPVGASEGVPSPILEGFMRSLDVKREQQTYVLSLSFTARSADRAAAIVNTLATVYVTAQVQAELDARRQSVAWLKERITSARGEIAAAEQAVRSLRAEMGSAPGLTAAPLVPPDPSRLHDLERDLDDKRVLYGALVERVTAAQQQQSMPVSDASILKPARAPERKSSPNTALITILSALVGLAAALGLATWREMADRTFRVPSQIEAELGLPFLGLLRRLHLPRGDRRILQGDWALPAKGMSLAGQRRSLGEHIRDRFSDPLRAITLAADGTFPHGRPAVVGITSAVAGEGRSTVSANLAGFLGGQGRRVLLIDADLRNPMLSRASAPTASVGLTDVIGGTMELDDTIVRDAQARCDLLPACGSRKLADGVLGLDDLEKVLGQLARRYDVIVLDLPPLSALSEVAALTPAIGALVLVVGWGSTDRAVVAAALQAAPPVANRMVGAVLNRVKTRSMRRLARDPRDIFYLDGAKRSRLPSA